METFPAPAEDPLTHHGMIALTLSVASVAAWVFGGASVSRRVRWLLGIACVATVSGALAATGRLASTRASPPPMAFLMVAVLLGSIVVGTSKLGLRIADHASVASLVALQAFRLPLELLMHHAASKEIMPPQLSYSGFNFDIVTGIAAIPVALALIRNEGSITLVWIWNLWGLLCLTVIVGIAIATSPMVHAFGTAPRNVNTWVLHFPYVWLPAILVSTALVSHIVLTRKLLARRR